MRTLLFELRPAALEAAPLEALLARLGDALAGQLQVPVDVQTDGGVAVPPDVKLVLYRVAQEAFSNVAKHARATRVGIDLHANDDGDVALIVYDDGNGFDPGSVAHDRMGLRIMRERTDRVGASLAIDSEPGGGTTITVIWQGSGIGTGSAADGGVMNDPQRIRVMIVDDHHMVREGLKFLLSTALDLDVVGEAANGAGGRGARAAHRAGRRPHGHRHAGHERRRRHGPHQGGVPGGPGRSP